MSEQHTPGHYHGSHLRYLIEVRRLRISDAVAGMKADLDKNIRSLGNQKRNGMISMVAFGLFGLPLFTIGSAIPVLGTIAAIAVPAVWRSALGAARNRLETELAIVNHSAHFEELLLAMSTYIDSHPGCGVSLNAFVNAYETALNNYQTVAHQDVNLDAMCQSFLAALRSQIGCSPTWFNQLVHRIDLEIKGRNVDLHHMNEVPIGSVEPRTTAIPSWQAHLYGMTPQYGNAFEVLSEPPPSQSRGLPGNNTKINAIPVPARSSADDSGQSDETVSEYVDRTPAPRDIEQAIEQSNIALFANGDINPRILKMPLKERGELLLDCLTQSGCDLRRYLRRPTVAYGGKQRSGKTTLAMLNLILQKAIDGQKIYYVTTDDDIYPVAFDGYMTSADPDEKQARVKLAAVYQRYIQLVTQAGVGDMNGQSWLLDEFTMSVSKLGNLTELLWDLVLTGAAKRGARLGAIFHEKTAGANGVPPGKAELFKSEFAFLWTDREENMQGDPNIAPYFPSGKYTLLEFKGNQANYSEECLEIPDWLRFDTNPKWFNSPCPVRSLLRFFPELDVRAGAIATNMLNKTSFASGSRPKPLGDSFATRSDRKAQIATSSETYYATTKEARQPSFVQEPKSVKISKLIEALEQSPDERAPAFIDFLLGLEPGVEITKTGIDPEFIRIAIVRKILQHASPSTVRVLT